MMKSVNVILYVQYCFIQDMRQIHYLLKRQILHQKKVSRENFIRQQSQCTVIRFLLASVSMLFVRKDKRLSFEKKNIKVPFRLNFFLFTT